MAAARLPWAADLLHFWFHELRPDLWFGRFLKRNRIFAHKSTPATIRAVAAGNAW
jgi:uncharacterized protein (DUF924 family)